ncbi:MAG: DUF5320 domain-containing protein [Candidatus Aminicenantes bacterium]
MPRGDRTGPMGLGPMTGRGMGLCGGNPGPGYMYGGPGFGFGRGFGRGLGFGRGYGRGMGFGRGRGWRRAGFGSFWGYPYPPMMPYGDPYGTPYEYPFPPSSGYPYGMGYYPEYSGRDIPQSSKKKK